MRFRKNLLRSRMLGTHSTKWIMNGVFLEGSGRIEDFQYAGCVRSLKLDGVNLFILIDQMYQIFRQRNIREIFCHNSSGDGPGCEWFPLRIVNIAWRISQWIGCHVHYGLGEVMLSEVVPDNSHAARYNRRGSLWYWVRWWLGMNWTSSTSSSGMRGCTLSCNRSGCHGRDGCCYAMRIAVVPRDVLILSRVLGTIVAGGNAFISPKSFHNMDAQALSCRPGKVKHISLSPCFPLQRTCPSAESVRQRIDCLRSRVVDAIPWDWGCRVVIMHPSSCCGLPEDV